MTPAPKRRWFRFSLRTLFVVVTVLGCWLGYELNWVRERRLFIADEISARQRHPTSYTWDAIVMNVRKTPTPKAPGRLWAFGEAGHPNICVLIEAESVEHLTNRDQDRVQKARKLFPEASISMVHVWDRPGRHGVMTAAPPN
jgi:hypothetical protein